MRFTFKTTSLSGNLLIETRIYEWDNITSTPVGPLLWSTGGAFAVISTAETDILYFTTALTNKMAESPAVPVNVATVPINAALKPDTNYVIIFRSPDSSAVGLVASRQEGDVYPEGRYYDNVNRSAETPLTGWTSARPTNDLAFTLTFSEIFECVGSWVPNPVWNVTGNTGSPQNCLESSCADYPTPLTPQPGRLDEGYQVTAVANLNGFQCNASYGSVALPLTNTIRTVPFEYYRLFDACSQTVPCLNCGPNATSVCFRNSTNDPFTACEARRNVTWPNPQQTSYTQSTAVLPVNGASGLPRAEMLPSVVPTPCPEPTFPACRCQDCVTRWNDTSVCYAVVCDNTNGLLNQTAIVVTLPFQDDAESPQLFRSCDVQIPSVPAQGSNDRIITCTNATGQFPCPILPTE